MTAEAHPSKLVLVTGANGFVGRRLCELLARRGHAVRAAIRANATAPLGAAEVCRIGELGPAADWTAAVTGVDAVIHLAAKAHVLDRPHDDGEYQRINGGGTQHLARAAAAAGVRRFVYLSSIKVYGDHANATAFRLEDNPQPTDVYGRSKLAGETFLQEVAATSALEAVIVRPPLVYGPGVRANFLRMLRWVDRELPLPLGAVQNSRSLVALDNLCDFLAHSLAHPQARTWLVSDGEDVSTPELIRRLAQAMQRRVRLVPMPPFMLRAAGALLGRGADVTRVLGSLTLDTRASHEAMGWRPPLAMSQALGETVKWYLDVRDNVDV
ncbi:MAG: NAD-dependent epimerase/dehydratase family protein [Pseudomonadota bacterium]